jgi:hypothetical protein
MKIAIIGLHRADLPLAARSALGANAALRRGVAAGVIRELGARLFEVGQDVRELDEGRFDPT